MPENLGRVLIQRERLWGAVAMKFRCKALLVHLLTSAAVLALIMGSLYAGWYHWPGWYLADASQVAAVMVGVDVGLGPLLTFVIASPAKPRRVLKRDIAMIVLVQLVALGYGTVSLWNGRPLYYAFSVNCLSLVQAYDIEPADAALGRERNPDLAPHWYSLPRWIWAPLPNDTAQAQKIVGAAISGGSDVTAMPIYYQSFEAGLKELRTQLQKMDDIKFFTPAQKQVLKARMQAAGIATDQVNGIAFTGRLHPLLAVFDPSTLKLVATFKFD
jgi:hypothetical protein